MPAPRSAGERRALRLALLLNLGLAAGLGTAGVLADSSGLIANGLDNLSDALVYAISYYAVNRSMHWKIRAARVSGVMLLVLSAAVLLDVMRRFIWGAEPLGGIMIAMTLVAGVVNIISLRLLQRFRHGDVNLRAAWTFSVNDLIANLGLLVAGILVTSLGHAWPDLLLGLAIAVVAAKGGIGILLEAQADDSCTAK